MLFFFLKRDSQSVVQACCKLKILLPKHWSHKTVSPCLASETCFWNASIFFSFFPDFCYLFSTGSTHRNTWKSQWLFSSSVGFSPGPGWPPASRGWPSTAVLPTSPSWVITGVTSILSLTLCWGQNQGFICASKDCPSEAHAQYPAFFTFQESNKKNFLPKSVRETIHDIVIFLLFFQH